MLVLRPLAFEKDDLSVVEVNFGEKLFFISAAGTLEQRNDQDNKDQSGKKNREEGQKLFNASLFSGRCRALFIPAKDPTGRLFLLYGLKCGLFPRQYLRLIRLCGLINNGSGLRRFFIGIGHFIVPDCDDEGLFRDCGFAFSAAYGGLVLPGVALLFKDGGYAVLCLFEGVGNTEGRGVLEFLLVSYVTENIGTLVEVARKSGIVFIRPVDSVSACILRSCGLLTLPINLAGGKTVIIENRIILREIVPLYFIFIRYVFRRFISTIL